MNASALTALFNRIPRRHSIENVKDIYGIVNEYEMILVNIEAINSFYEKREELAIMMKHYLTQYTEANWGTKISFITIVGIDLNS